MDQLKTLLRQLVKQRFWIAVGVAAILPLGVYFATAGSLNADTDKRIAEINGEKKKTEAFVNGAVPNNQHIEIIAEKAGVLKSEVDKTWQTLYDRQAPLMTWPETVADRFPAWGRAWPKDVDTNLVQDAITEYVNAMPNEVDKVYATFHPYDFKEGTGIVTAAPKEDLLRTPEFDFKNPPTLKQIWDIQQRLWLQRSLLEVVAQVNAEATDWDSATIKQIILLDVASVTAQDQPAATSKDSKLAKSADIVSDSAPPPVDASKGGMSPMGGTTMGMGGGGGGGEAGNNKPGANEEFYSVEAAGGQYRLYPVAIGVLMEQARIQEFLADLQASPVVVQVKELDVQRPTAHVQKPSKSDRNNFANMAGLEGGRNSYGSGRPMIFNPRMSMGPGGFPGTMGQPAGMAPAPMDTSMSTSMYGGRGGAASKKIQRKGVDLRAEAQSKREEEKAKKEADPAAAATKAEPPNPYYDIVQVTVYGQARFYIKPPEPPATPGSGAKAEASPGAADAPKADPSTEAPKDAPEADAKDAKAAADADAAKAGDRGKDADMDKDMDMDTGKGKEKAPDPAKAKAEKPAKPDPEMEDGEDAKTDDAAPEPAPTPRAKPAAGKSRGVARSTRK